MKLVVFSASNLNGQLRAEFSATIANAVERPTSYMLNAECGHDVTDNRTEGYSIPRTGCIAFPMCWSDAAGDLQFWEICFPATSRVGNWFTFFYFGMIQKHFA